MGLLKVRQQSKSGQRLGLPAIEKMEAEGTFHGQCKVFALCRYKTATTQAIRLCTTNHIYLQASKKQQKMDYGAES